MLAAAPSPAVRTGKRQLDEEEDPAACGSPAWGQDQLGALHLVKRHKVHALQHYSHQRASPGRCGLSAESGGAYAHPLYLPQATVSALRALFPEMDDKVGQYANWRGNRGLQVRRAGVFLTSPQSPSFAPADGNSCASRVWQQH
jgi:hypothetical protein